MFTHAVAVAPDIDHVTMVRQPVDQGGGHHFVPEDGAPFLETLVRRQDGRRVLIAGVDQIADQFLDNGIGGRHLLTAWRGQNGI